LRRSLPAIFLKIELRENRASGIVVHAHCEYLTSLCHFKSGGASAMRTFSRKLTKSAFTEEGGRR
jgi:hypothetical protein